MRDYIFAIIDKGRKYKRILVPSGEVVILAMVLFVSYWIRLGGIDRTYFTQIIFLAVTVVPLKIAVFWLFRLYHISFRFISMYEILTVLKASFISNLVFALIITVLRDVSFLKGFPRSVIFIDFMLTFITGSGLRLAFRFFYFPQVPGEGKIRALIVGAGSAGAQLAREMITGPLSKYVPVAFVDDDPGKQGSIILGVRIAGTKEDIPGLANDFKVEEIIISIPSASSA